MLFESILFSVRLYGLTGAIGFFWNVMRHPTIQIFSLDLKKNRDDKRKLINTELDLQLIKTEEEFERVLQDYSAVKGKSLSLEDRKKICSGKEYLGVIYHGRDFAGWGWVKKGPVTFGSNKLSETECAIVKCRTLRNHRRKRVYLTLMIKLQDTLEKLGYTKAYGCVIPFNKASLGGVCKAGFELLEECNRGSFLERLLRKITGKPPRVQV